REERALGLAPARGDLERYQGRERVALAEARERLEDVPRLPRTQAPEAPGETEAVDAGAGDRVVAGVRGPRREEGPLEARVVAQDLSDGARAAQADDVLRV